ncbi:hypothetical protein BBJ28_00013827 [Nothophytophthora sp. Chile5]|nr:hypothetical protein BBJ28_00013827 [Nothophytophthora sp. Chile5]
MAAANPWEHDAQERAGQHYRVSLGGLQAFVQRNQLVRPLPLRLDMRELERLEHAIATAGCVLPSQLQLKMERVITFRDQLAALLAMKPVLLRTLRKSAGSETLDVELEHQRTFIDVFCQIGQQLPRYTHVLGLLENIHVVTGDLARRQDAYVTAVDSLKTIIAQYQTAYDELSQLRNMYSQLQRRSAAA